MKKIIFFILFFYNLTLHDLNVSFGVENTMPEFLFLQNINDFTADFQQQEYTDKKTIISNGRFVVKKPDSILLEHNSETMRLKIVSINGNMKMVDQDLGQTTYIDNKYTELMQFFTKNLKPENLTTNKNKELCMRFNHMDNVLEACLKVDIIKYTLQYIKVYIVEETALENKIEQYKNTKKYKIMDIVFSNTNINKGVDDDEFFVKDSRIFGDED